MVAEVLTALLVIGAFIIIFIVLGLAMSSRVYPDKPSLQEELDELHKE